MLWHVRAFEGAAAQRAVCHGKQSVPAVGLFTDKYTPSVCHSRQDTQTHTHTLETLAHHPGSEAGAKLLRSVQL